MIFFKKFLSHKNLIHSIMEVKDGPVNIFSYRESRDNLLKVLKSLGFKDYSDENLIFAEQVHGNQFYLCPAQRGGYIKLQRDALVSRWPHQILIVRSADCIPLLFYDFQNQIIGVIHAGRKGLFKEIILRTLKGAKINPSTTLAGLGPHIRRCCYFLKNKALKNIKDQRWRKYLGKNKEKYYLDLTRIALDQLKQAGIEQKNIEDLKICTYCHAYRFFSARYHEDHPEFYKPMQYSCFGSLIGLNFI